ncbi:SMP-30/gluconolactonase/LRE family protein [Nonomuraea spiralis]|uniref:SMP-30/gluconolactonase/LRE family protein n=1 Tax=Nonomuraea spiralis TaxID=46182 RepID=A0ABV5IQ81_9ACTN|nr:SMP-30/gluconolactonase/LRE family protein [Nonomuraea spiralis]GGT11715.1 hypothetical protein GCM10010176_065530 [Nonomuraea spiralis]
MFEVYPNGQAVPEHLEAGAATSLLEFTELSAVDTATGRRDMWIRIVKVGAGCGPSGPPHPAVRLKADTGDVVEVPISPTPVVLLNGPQGSPPAANANMAAEADDVYLVRVTVLRQILKWRLQLVNNDAAARDFVWVVADHNAESRQPWIDLPTTLDFEVDVGQEARRSLQVVNRGTGTLTMGDGEGFQPGPGFVLSAVPKSIGPNACANLDVTFTGVPGPATVHAVYDATSNDTKAKTTPGHNHRVTLTAVARLAPGTILLADRDAARADGDCAGGVIRVDPTTGKQVRLLAGDHIAAPSGVAIEAAGTILIVREDALVRLDLMTGQHSVVASGDPLGRFHVGLVIEDDGQVLLTHTGRKGHGRGQLIRVRPDTGEKTVLTDSECDFAGVALEADGTILVVEQGMSPDRPRALLRVDRHTGQPTVLTTFDPPCRPVGLAVEPDGQILVTDAVSTDGTGRLIRFNPTTGNKTVVSTGQFFRSPWGIAVEPTGSILVSDHEAFGHKGGVIRVHPQTGEQTTVSAGGLLTSPLMITLVPHDGRRSVPPHRP